MCEGIRLPDLPSKRPVARRHAPLAALVAWMGLAALALPAAAQEPTTSAEPGGVIVPSVFTGGSTNEIMLPAGIARAGVANIEATLTYEAPSGWLAELLCPNQSRRTYNMIRVPGSESAFGVLVRSDPAGGEPRVVLTVKIPEAPCAWPPFQDAHLSIATGAAAAAGEPVVLETQFDQQVRVSVKWFALVTTLALVAVIYPFCACVAWYVRRRRYLRSESSDKKPSNADEKPSLEHPGSFWRAINPVQITANAYGRGSLAKLQIFGFTLIVFGLLLYHLLRTGILAEISADIMILLGISALGAVGGKLVHNAKRRLSLENWTWLRSNGWLPDKGDIRANAEWRDLFVDYDSKELDIYSIQMAVFSLVVAIALLSTSLQGLGSFDISENILILLGLSQAVFVLGRSTSSTGFQELDDQLTKVVRLERKPEKTEAETTTLAEEKRRAADMFAAVYGDELGEIPDAVTATSIIGVEMAQRRQGTAATADQ